MWKDLKLNMIYQKVINFTKKVNKIGYDLFN